MPATFRGAVVALVVVGCRPATPGASPLDMSAEDHNAAAGQHDRVANASWTNAGGEADAHRKMADDHRAASQALRDAEAKACGGLGPSDRDESPFAHRDDLLGVEPLVSTTSSSRGPTKHVDGASITVRAVPGLTAEYLQRLVSCHLARNASMGFAMNEMSFCPLAVKGASATVVSGSGAFRVDVRGDGEEAIQEITRRGDALVRSHAR